MIDESTFEGAGGRELFYRCSVTDDPRAVVVVLHGLGEHSGRYVETMERFASQGYPCYTMDLRGFGHSARVLGHIERAALVREDIRLFTEMVSSAHPGLPVVLLGHSMGGLLALDQLLSHQGSYNFGITSGPAVLPPENTSSLVVALSGILARLVPLMPVSSLEDDAETRNEELKARDDEDDLIWDGGFRARTGYELLQTQMNVTKRLGEITLPLLALHGGGDLIMNPRATEILVESVSSEDKTKIIFPGLYHEVLNEPERDDVFAAIFEWLDERVR